MVCIGMLMGKRSQNTDADCGRMQGEVWLGKKHHSYDGKKDGGKRTDPL